MIILSSFGKRVLDFLLMLIELFSLGVTAYTNESAISLQRGRFDPKFRVEGVVPYHPSFFAEN